MKYYFLFSITLFFMFPANTYSQNNISDLRKKIWALENDKAVQKEEIRLLEIELKTKQDEINRLSQSGDIDGETQAINDLQKLLAKSEKERKKLLDLNAAKGNLIRQLMKENSQLREQVNNLIEENEELMDKILALEITIDSLNNKIEEVQENLNYATFINNLRVVATNCYNFDKDYIEFGFVLISDGTETKVDVPLVIVIKKKEKQNKEAYFLQNNGREFITRRVTTQDFTRVKFESENAFSTKSDLLRMRNNNYTILFFHRDDEARKIIGVIDIINLKDDCIQPNTNGIAP